MARGASSGGRRGPTRTTSIPLTSASSNVSLVDLFPLPLPLYVAFRIVQYILKHWYVFGVIGLFFFVDPYLAVFLLLLVPLFTYGYYAYVNRDVPQSPPTLSLAMTRAALRTTRNKINWQSAALGSGLQRAGRVPSLTRTIPGVGRPARPPQFTAPDGNSITYTIDSSKTGLTFTDLEDAKDPLTAYMGARRARLNRVRPGISTLTLEYGDITKSGIVKAKAVSLIHDTQLPRVPIDVSATTTEVSLELDTSLLVVGESGSGKSNLTWNVLNRLNSPLVKQPYKVYVVDPKKVELSELADSPFCLSYSDSAQTSDETINLFHKDMMERFDWMKTQKLRKYPLTQPGHDLRILVIDELLLCKQASKGIDSPLGDILSAGRAAGFIVIGNAQLGQVDAIGRLRDLFPQRVCMAVKSQELVDAVLGPGSFKRGARATEITEKGVGYIWTDHSGSFQRFKPPYIPDHVTSQIALGEYYEPTLELTKKKRG